MVETKFVVDVLVFGEQSKEIEVPVSVKVLHGAHLFTDLGYVLFRGLISNCSNKVLLVFDCNGGVYFERIVNHSLIHII